MSLSTQSRRNRPGRTLAALVLLGCTAQWLGAGGAAAAEVTVVSAGMSRTDGRASLVVDVASEPISPGAFAVTADTVPEQADAVALLSDQLAVGLVVDGSDDGRAALQSGLTGAANFVLEQPLAGAVVVADKSPPRVMSTAEARPADVVPALSGIQPEGQRQTSEALSVALGELERMSTRSRMLILHTAAADAGGEPAADLAARLIDAHTPLAVVSTNSDAGYWREVTGLTGGVLIVQGVGNVFAAFDQMADAMRDRYLVTFKPTYDPPLTVSVRVDTANGPATAYADVPEPRSGPSAAPAAPTDPDGVPLLAIATLLAVGCLGLFGLRTLDPSRPAVPARRAPAKVDSPTVPTNVLAGPAKVTTRPAEVSASPTEDSTRPIDSAGARNATDTETVPTPTAPPIESPANGAEAEALTARLPVPPQTPAAEPPRAEPAICVCGCGRKVRPGRAFINWEHQSRWMRGGGRLSR